MRKKGTSFGTWAFWAVTGTATALALEPTSAALSADSRPAPTDAEQGRRPHGPPPEAVDACANSNEGDACSVVIGERTIHGTCRSGPRGDEPLVCLPKHPPRPPQAAVTACEGHSAGDACSFVIDEDTIQGTCRSGPHSDEALACMPVPPA